MTDEPYQFRPIDRSQHKLLVINDDPATRYAIARVLRAAGFQTVEAATGTEGLQAAQAEDLSAMVVDVHLPDIDGFELCRILRSQGATIRMPVLHLSAAYVTDEDKVRGLDSGADAYLTHPVEPAVLVATVQALVRTRVAEEAMRRSESKFRAIYEQAPSGLALIDGDGCVRDANPQMLHMLGRGLAEVVGRRLQEFERPADDAAPGDRRELVIDTPDGRSIHLSFSISAQIEPGVSLIVATDISQRAALETQRQQLLERERIARSEAERVSRLKDTFIAVLSHELRSPLNAMVGWTHVLQQRGGSDETMRALAAIERNGRLQARMISDLLDMSRLNLGKLPLSLDSVDPGEAVAAAVAAVQPDLDAKQVELRIEAREGVGLLRADSSRLQQVIWNLLSNAVKFSPRGGRVTVGLHAEEGGDVVLTVSDQGQGIAPDFLPFVFDRFMQSDAGRNRQHGGLGLGLSIVKQLVEAHGGQVRVHSAGLGQGATFEVRLPQEGQAPLAERPATVADAPDSLLAPLNDGDGGEAPLAGLQLLVVDDDADASGMLQIILRDRGASVRVAGSSALALAALQESAFDVLISDIGMPGKDGYELVRELRGLEAGEGRGRHLPAIALTSFTRGQDEAHALAAGFDAHCPKPLRPLKLVGLVARLAGR